MRILENYRFDLDAAMWLCSPCRLPNAPHTKICVSCKKPPANNDYSARMIRVMHRSLLIAEITIPGLPKPLIVGSTHLDHEMGNLNFVVACS
jgi:hypothetical protein